MSETAPRYTLWQAMSAAVNLSLRAIEEVRALSRQPGPVGQEGPPGKLGKVRGWAEGVWYEGDTAVHGGSTYQALRDTASTPPHDDWLLIAAKGRDGESIDVRGKWEPDQEYRIGSVVGWDGAVWMAKRSDPGTPGDGDGWMVFPRPKQGKPGDPGRKGDPGKDGRDGASIIAFRAVGDGPEMVAVRDDGETIPFDIEPVLRWYHDQVTR